MVQLDVQVQLMFCQVILKSEHSKQDHLLAIQPNILTRVFNLCTKKSQIPLNQTETKINKL